MTLTNNSKQRLQACADMIDAVHTATYCAGLFSIPVSELRDYVIGLSTQSSTDMPEIDTSEPDWAKHAGFPAGEKALQKLWDTPVRTCPYPNGGHLSTGGVQGHSAGDIFPYTIVLVGGVDPTDHDYHLIGGGLRIGDCKWGHYNAAHNYATQLLNPLLME